jgi:hypothetical protein
VNAVTDAELVAEGERLALVADADPTYVHPSWGRHTPRCWGEAFPVGECWCAGTPADETVERPLAALFAMTGDAA